MILWLNKMDKVRTRVFERDEVRDTFPCCSLGDTLLKLFEELGFALPKGLQLLLVIHRVKKERGDLLVLSDIFLLHLVVFLIELVNRLFSPITHFVPPLLIRFVTLLNLFGLTSFPGLDRLSVFIGGRKDVVESRSGEDGGVGGSGNGSGSSGWVWRCAIRLRREGIKYGFRSWLGTSLPRQIRESTLKLHDILIFPSTSRTSHLDLCTVYSGSINVGKRINTLILGRRRLDRCRLGFNGRGCYRVSV